MNAQIAAWKERETGNMCIWVFGSAVQDITVEVDLDRLTRKYGGEVSQRILLADQGPQIINGQRLETQFGSKRFAVDVEIQPTEKMRLMNGLWTFIPGIKYDLIGDVLADSYPDKCPSFFLPCENLSWGGGGVNSVTYMRELAPGVDIKYTDIAMSPGLTGIADQFEDLQRNLPTQKSGRASNASFSQRLRAFYETDRVRAEEVTSEIARTAAEHVPERSLEVYLASLPVRSALYRPAVPRFRRNWVFSRFLSSKGEIGNKIVCRGASVKLTDNDLPGIKEFLNSHMEGVRAFLLNSLKDEPLFRGAYAVYETAYQRNPEKVVGIMAMTKSMHQFVKPLMMMRKNKKHTPPFILIFNEEEVCTFAKDLDKTIEPFMEHPDDIPDIKKFGKLACVLRERFQVNHVPRIYVTLGPRGSLGINGTTGMVVYVASFATPGGTIYDTNTCGDAYCAAIALLEWAKRAKFPPSIGDTDEEMIQFMAIATAAAYAKATNRHGRLDRTAVQDLLENMHLAGRKLCPAQDLGLITQNNHPDWVDTTLRLKIPDTARIMGVDNFLNRLNKFP